jgi:hypothetical protein
MYTFHKPEQQQANTLRKPFIGDAWVVTLARFRWTQEV